MLLRSLDNSSFLFLSRTSRYKERLHRQDKSIYSRQDKMLSRGFAESTMIHPLAHQPSLDADGTEGARTRRARPAPAPGDTSKKKARACPAPRTRPLDGSTRTTRAILQVQAPGTRRRQPAARSTTTTQPGHESRSRRALPRPRRRPSSSARSLAAGSRRVARPLDRDQ
jgi:hypothetical protein